MRFFTKIVLICNGCFLAAVILRWIELMNKSKEHFDGAIKLQPLASTVVVLGYGAVIINFLFNAMMLVLLLMKRYLQAPKWVIWLNFLFLIIQVYYFFFS